MQGSTWGPLKCSVQMDQIAVSECGQPSINVNVAINAKIGIECWEVPPNTCWKIQ